MANYRYGRRSQKTHLNTGLRDVAPTFGTAAHFTAIGKVNQSRSFLPDGQPEALVAHALQLDPTIRGVKPQALTVDLVEQRLLFSRQERDEAKKKYLGRAGHSLYTPDFEAEVASSGLEAIEVKLEGHQGDDEYRAMLDDAAKILTNFGYRLSEVVITSDQTKAPWTTVPYLHQASLRRDLLPTGDLLDRIDVLAEKGARTGRDFIQGLEILPGHLYVLITSGALSADPLLGPIRGSTPMAPAHGDLSHLHLFDRLRA